MLKKWLIDFVVHVLVLGFGIAIISPLLTIGGTTIIPVSPEVLMNMYYWLIIAVLSFTLLIAEIIVDYINGD